MLNFSFKRPIASQTNGQSPSQGNSPGTGGTSNQQPSQTQAQNQSQAPANPSYVDTPWGFIRWVIEKFGQKLVVAVAFVVGAAGAWIGTSSGGQSIASIHFSQAQGVGVVVASFLTIVAFVFIQARQPNRSLRKIFEDILAVLVVFVILLAIMLGAFVVWMQSSIATKTAGANIPTVANIDQLEQATKDAFDDLNNKRFDAVLNRETLDTKDFPLDSALIMMAKSNATILKSGLLYETVVVSSNLQGDERAVSFGAFQSYALKQAQYTKDVMDNNRKGQKLFVLIPVNDGGSEEQGKKSAQYINSLNPAPVAVLGPSNSSTAKAFEDNLRPEISLLKPTPTAETVCESTTRLSLSYSPCNTSYAESIRKFATGAWQSLKPGMPVKQYKSVAIVSSGITNANNLAMLTEPLIQGAKGFGAGSDPQNPKPLSSQTLEALKSFNPDLIVLTTNYLLTKNLVQQLQGAGIKADKIATDSSFIAASSKSSVMNGVYAIVPFIAEALQDKDSDGVSYKYPQGQAFLKEYESLYQGTPNFRAAMSFDAITTLTMAAEMSRSDRAEYGSVSSALSALRSGRWQVQGLLGARVFTARGRAEGHPLYFTQIINQKFVRVGDVPEL